MQLYGKGAPQRPNGSKDGSASDRAHRIDSFEDRKLAPEFLEARSRSRSRDAPVSKQRKEEVTTASDGLKLGKGAPVVACDNDSVAGMNADGSEAKLNSHALSPSPSQSYDHAADDGPADVDGGQSGHPDVSRSSLKRRRLKIQPDSTAAPSGSKDSDLSSATAVSSASLPKSSPRKGLAISWSLEAYKCVETRWAINPSYSGTYGVTGLLGEGSFGYVYKGFDSKKHEEVALKIMKPQRLSAIKREVYILSILAEKPNIITLVDVTIDWLTQTPCLIFEYLEHEDYGRMFAALNIRHVADYMRQLLTALHHCHCHCILHRDIKPANIVYQKHKKRLKLIDWGTADIFLINKDYAYRVGTRAFRAPELLAGSTRYDYSVDMWGTGCVFWQMLHGARDPMFGYGSDEVDQIKRIAARLGRTAFSRFVSSLRTGRLEKGTSSDILKTCPAQPKSWDIAAVEAKVGGTAECRTKMNTAKELGAFELLDMMISMDTSRRPLPATALDHRFFSHPVFTNDY